MFFQHRSALLLRVHPIVIVEIVFTFDARIITRIVGRINVVFVPQDGVEGIPIYVEITHKIGINQHKIIILKGKNAQSEINKVSIASNYSYKLEDSVTDNDSKIIVIKVG